ncbi:hypothetical protein TNCV_1951581 [Trichonephila clavipes]|nr:hypothetical protein TNCV_1951581 [Trichonephila clavipes]
MSKIDVPGYITLVTFREGDTHHRMSRVKGPQSYLSKGTLSLFMDSKPQTTRAATVNVYLKEMDIHSTMRLARSLDLIPVQSVSNALGY